MLDDEGPYNALNKLGTIGLNSALGPNVNALSVDIRPNLLGVPFMGGLGLLDPVPPQRTNALADLGGIASAYEQRPQYLEAYAAANYEEELQSPYWTRDDAVPISIGINPIFARPKILARNQFEDDVAMEAMRRRDLIEKAHEMGDLPPQFRPLQFINWARGQGISLPEDLVDTAVKRGLAVIDMVHPAEQAFNDLKTSATAILNAKNSLMAALEVRIQEQADLIAAQKTEISSLKHEKIAVNHQATAPEAEAPRSSAQTRNYNTAVKLLYAFAVAKYGFDLNKPTAPVVSKILRDLEELAVRPDDQTLMKHLRNGAEQAARQT